MKHKIFFVAALLTLGGMQVASADTLYDQLGGKPGVSKVIDDFVTHVANDGRINHYFANANIPRLKMLLVEQVCAGTGGGCTYTGRSMPETHKGMHITSAHFNALVEDLQAAMSDNRVPIAQQNKLLAILAPMKPDVDYK
jgi:hemoglobin